MTENLRGLSYYVDLRLGVIDDEIWTPDHAEHAVSRLFGDDVARYARDACGEKKKPKM